MDVTVPSDLEIVGSKGKVLVPLALIAKARLRDVDTADRDGKTIPILGTLDNSQLALDLLVDLAPAWIVRDPELWATCETHINELVAADVPNGPERASFDRWIATLTTGEGSEVDPDLAVFAGLARQLSENFLFIVEVDRNILDVRTVLKFSHDLDSPAVTGGAETAGFGMQIADFGFAASQHIEVQVPAGLAVESMYVVELDPSGEPVDYDFDIAEVERTTSHVALSPGSRFSTGELRVDVIPARRGIYWFALLTVPVVLLLTVLAWLDKTDVLEIVSADFKVPSPSASLFLVGPAIFLSWQARAPEHALTGTLLSPLRHMFMLSATSLVLMAAAAAIPLQHASWEVLWIAVGGTQVVATIWLLAFRLNFPIMGGRPG
ncbi:hypothetical protein ACS5PJ_02395 [Pseudarthrobacter sp. YS3]|uniref:hypothetical protein n=1 Tax=Pseudarthrobacter sp. YS3 TaxID=3453718 RepID=UPI003EEC0966